MNALDVFGSVAGTIVFLFLCFLCLFWMIFPWMVYHKLNKILEALAASEIAIRSGSLTQKSMFEYWQKTDAAMPPPPGAEVYFIAKGIEVIGPHTRHEIDALLNKKAIDGQTPLLKQGDKHWKKASDVLG